MLPMSPSPVSGRDRGAVAIMVAVALPLLAAFVALAVDVGHAYLVRNQLQNAADAAAMAGARALDGTPIGNAAARLSAMDFAARHNADGRSVQIDLNLGNAPGGDTVLGRWHLEGKPPWFEVIASPDLHA